jgi:hypothetical protein
LKRFKEQELIPARFIQIVFSNIEQILPVNEELLQRLENRRKDNYGLIEEVGDIFVALSQFFKMYSLYCGNQPEAIAYLRTQKDNSDLKLFLQVRYTCYIFFY